LPHPLSYRLARVEDIFSLIELYRRLAFYESSFDSSLIVNTDFKFLQKEFYRMLRDPRYYIMVALDQDTVIGYLNGFLLSSKEALLQTLYVNKEYRKKGVGTHLVESFFDWGKQRGCDSYKVTAYASNVRAVKFYQKFGFCPFVYQFSRNIS